MSLLNKASTGNSKEFQQYRRFRDLLLLVGVRKRLANTLVNELFHLTVKWQRTMGSRETSRRFKVIQQSVFEESRADGWVSVDPIKRRIPGLPKLSNLWKRGKIRLVMSCLNHHREMSDSLKVDVTSIVTPGINMEQWYSTYGEQFNEVLIEFKNEVMKSKDTSLDKNASQFMEIPSLKLLATSKKRSYSLFPLHFSSKVGPVGRQMMNFGVHASAALEDSTLRDSLLEFSQAMGHKEIPSSFWRSDHSWSGKAFHSRIVGIPDKSCKTRVIAIGDYLSQSLLYPLHKSLMKILSNIQEDGTYDQNKAVKQLASLKTFYGSVDLKNATDRLPVDLQKDLINCLFPGIGEPWSKVMRNRTFVCKGIKPVKYAVGQPMGLLSSWAAMALSHHTIVRLARKIVKRKFDYRVLGDDIVICDLEGSRVYMKIMQDLGVTLSASTLLSPDRFVFAKKSYLRGKNVSPMSWAVARLMSNHLNVPSVLSHIRSVVEEQPSLRKVLSFYTGKSRKELKILLTSPELSDLVAESHGWISSKKYKVLKEKIILDRILRKEVRIPYERFNRLLGLDFQDRPTINDLNKQVDPIRLLYGELLITKKAFEEIRYLHTNGPKQHFSTALAGFRQGLRFFDDPDSVQEFLRESQALRKQVVNKAGLLILSIYRLHRVTDN